jgi:DNA topoisomerase IA
MKNTSIKNCVHFVPTGNQQKVYKFIVRHFLACCSKDAKGQETKVKIDIAGEKVNNVMTPVI